MTEQPGNSGQPKPRKSATPSAHEVTFVTNPKLLFIWPVIVAGLVFYPLGYPAAAPAAPAAAPTAPVQQPDADAENATDTAAAATTAPAPGFDRLGTLGWIYIWVLIVVLLTLGVDVDRNQFVFWLVLIVLFWVLGLWLKDAKGITFFGDVYRWFASLNVEYNRSLGLALSVLLLVPYLIMLGWARLNDRWRITHNEFEHHSFGKMDDSLGRGAKSIRAIFPDVLELALGLAGTLIVYNATGTKELRRIPHVMFLPFVRRRLDKILEKTAITGLMAADEEEDQDDEA
jgi:hypothetical protein